MKILVTGATGALGLRVVETLLKKISADQIVACVQDLTKADILRSRGVEVRQATFDDPTSLDEAFKGVDRILVISTREPNDEKRVRQHLNAVEAAKRANVKHLIYTSGANGANNPIPIMRAHQATEKGIIESGIPYTILRNNLYLENEINTIKACMMGAPIVTSTGEGKVGFALRNDYADAAANVLIQEGHENKIYELGGKLVTYDELGQEIGNVLDKNIVVKHVNDDEFSIYLKNAGIPEMMIPVFVSMKSGIRNGAVAVESNDLEMLLGHPVTPISEAIRELVNKINQ